MQKSDLIQSHTLVPRSIAAFKCGAMCNINSDLKPHMIPAGISFPDFLYLIPITTDKSPEATANKGKERQDVILMGCCNQLACWNGLNYTHAMRS